MLSDHALLSPIFREILCERAPAWVLSGSGLLTNVWMSDVKSFGIRLTVSALILMVAAESHLLPVFLSPYFLFHPFCQRWIFQGRRRGMMF